MAQHDYNIANAGGATVRADINNVLAAIQSANSGTGAPSSTVAGMLWLDTSGGLPYAIKIRDGGNNHWLTIGTVDDPGADKGMEISPSKINLPSSGGVYESDGSTEILTESSGAVTLKNTTIDSNVIFPAGGTGNPISVAVIADEKAYNADGGTSSVGFQDRELNTEISDPDGIVSIASNQFTLSAGTYLITWIVPAYRPQRHFSVLYDVTAGADLQVSQLAYAFENDLIQTTSSGSYIHTITSSNTYKIRQYIQVNQTTFGYGVAHDQSGYNSIYTLVNIYKLK